MAEEATKNQESQAPEDKPKRGYATHQGVTLKLSEWAARAGISTHILRNRLRIGWTLAKAVTTPLRRAAHPNMRVEHYKGKVFYRPRMTIKGKLYLLDSCQTPEAAKQLLDSTKASIEKGEITLKDLSHRNMLCIDGVHLRQKAWLKLLRVSRQAVHKSAKRHHRTIAEEIRARWDVRGCSFWLDAYRDD